MCVCWLLYMSDPLSVNIVSCLTLKPVPACFVDSSMNGLVFRNVNRPYQSCVCVKVFDVTCFVWVSLLP